MAMSGMGKRFRAATNEQFTRGTSIDIRLDRACQDLTDRWNNIKRRHMRGLLVPQCYTMGWTPVQEEDGDGGFGTVDHHMPWMRTYNAVIDTVDAVAPTAADFLNPWRHKGHRAQEILSEDGGVNTGRQWAWTSAFSSSYPLIIDHITVWLGTDDDGVLHNQFQWSAVAPYPPNEADDYVSDWNVVLMADHPFSLERRNHSALVLSLFDRRADCTFFSSEAPAAPAFDFQPNYNRLPCNGLVARMRHLGVSMPAGARWRLGVMIPEYDVVAPAPQYDSPWHGDGVLSQVANRHFHFQRYSVNIWALQEVI
jgi:hypothetical protein